jgi:hypothetical protein
MPLQGNNKEKYHRDYILSMKTAVFWDVAPCSLVDVYRRFRDDSCLHHQGYDGGSKYL